MMEQRRDDDDRESPDDAGRTPTRWVAVAETTNRTLAEFAVNGLKSYEIPAVLDPRPGFLGTAGLKMRSLRTGKLDAFRIMVPEEYQEEAAAAVTIFLGEDNAREAKDGLEDEGGE